CATSPARPAPPMTGKRAAIVAAMGEIKQQVGACLDRSRQSGSYDLALTMSRDGSVLQAHVVGDRAGNEAARCIEETAMRGLHMPPSETDGTYSIVYPYRYNKF
ncbi:MAG TPA: hypothetical protein VHB97_00125, partial [Polyangia bacterium]|nr:hypothetical protein [Polyangia bacterium]